MVGITVFRKEEPVHHDNKNTYENINKVSDSESAEKSRTICGVYGCCISAGTCPYFSCSFVIAEPQHN